MIFMGPQYLILHYRYDDLESGYVRVAKPCESLAIRDYDLASFPGPGLGTRHDYDGYLC